VIPAPSFSMKNILLLLALSTTAAVAQEPAPAAQTQSPSANGTAPIAPGQTMGAPVPDTNAPPTATQTSGLLSPPPDNPPVVPNTPAPAPAPVPAPAAATTTTTTTVAGAHSMSGSEIRQINRQEIVRRQEQVYRADQAMIQARKDEVAQRFPESRANYLFAVQVYGSISHSTSRYQTAAAGLERVDLALYADALKFGDTARAKMLIDEAVQYNPTDKVALDKQRQTDEAIANPNDTSLLGNPAVTPGFVSKLNEVQNLFIEAEQFRRTGQYDEAETRLKRILGIDPYNMAATKQLERIAAEKTQYAEHARIETREEMLRQVQEAWYQPITNKDTNVAAQEAQAPISRATNFDLDQKLRSIFIPALNFTNGASIEEATSFLFSESKRLDEPTHKGIPFIIEPDASASAKPITLSLNNVPVGEALRYICQLANVKYKVQDYAVSIVPFNASTDDLISRIFIVPPTFVAPPEQGTDTAGTGGSTNPNLRPVTPLPIGGGAGSTAASTQSVLEAKGVKFPPGASAVYTASTNTLTVVNTADQMELIEELVNGAQAPTLMVRIAAKFVEINQNDENDLTFNYSFNTLNPTTVGLPALPSNVLTTPGFATSLPGASGFTPDSIDQLITPQNTLSNTLQIGGSLSGFQYRALISALSQKRSFDLLSEPTALTKSGEQATMEAIRVFPYPVAFDPPELVTQTNTNQSITVVTPTPPTVIATTPTDFKRRNIGVRLVIKPQVTADNQAVDLSLFPEVTDFEGFIDYGSEIFIGNPDGTTSLLSSNDINQPVFNTRRINTKVLIHDGSTVVLGGLIREDLQTINDKVPVLGDIPLLGRLFQSKATMSNKRNLIIFVTANIYQNDGELLNPPEPVNALDVLAGRTTYAAPASP
jgi:general secretion pathway protein D